MDSHVVGRDDTLAVLDEAVQRDRWVSVVGPPGSGKTLVARRLAHALGEVAWVNAQGLPALPEVLTACLDGLRTTPAPGDSLEGALRRTLDASPGWLVVDGVDVDGLDPVLADIIGSTSEARVLTTSTTLDLHPGQRVVRLGPLPLPARHEPLTGAAVELFCHRVEQAGGHPVDLAASADDVRRLLEASGGLPLLIEQIAVQIALVGMTRVVPTASLSEAVHSSYDLLDEEQQRCFRRLSTMTSPVSIEVLAAITGVDVGTARDLALGLVRRSLVEAGPDGRIDMLAPVRRHGAFLTASTDDAEEATLGLMRWADQELPVGFLEGAGDASWLDDLPALRTAVSAACADPRTRAEGYTLANRSYSSLYTSMRAREAVEILESALLSGDGPPEIGAQVARRAGIAASEVRGTYEGLWLLDRADEHARHAAEPDLERARTASIRAEMHLDAGDLDASAAEAHRAVELDAGSDRIAPQAIRTLADAALSRGDLSAAAELASSLLTTRMLDEPWITHSGRLLLARVALEQGRHLEAATGARSVRDDARRIHQDRIALLAEVLLYQATSGDPGAAPPPDDAVSLPWAVRLPVLVAQARWLLQSGDPARAAGRAADAVVLADGARLGRDALDARILLASALSADGDRDQAVATFLQALEQAARMPAPLRAADVLDGLALLCEPDGGPAASLLASAAALRGPRLAVGGPRGVTEPDRTPPPGWVEGTLLSERAVAEVADLLARHLGRRTTPAVLGPLEQLTPAERAVAGKVAEGLTSRRIAADLFLSPRTVDAHLAHIYRKLGINTRARLAALVADQR